MSEDEVSTRTVRERIADLLPGVVAFVFGLGLFDSSGPVERLVYAALLGILLHMAAVAAYGVASWVVAHVSGHSTRGYDDLALSGDRRTAMVLVAVSVWVMGQTWVANKVDDIVECIEEQALDAPGRTAYDTGMIRWCAEEYEQNDDYPTDW